MIPGGPFSFAASTFVAHSHTVRLVTLGQNKLALLAAIRPLLGFSPAECRSAAEAGSLVILRGTSLPKAHHLARELTDLGAIVEVEADRLREHFGP